MLNPKHPEPAGLGFFSGFMVQGIPFFSLWGLHVQLSTHMVQVRTLHILGPRRGSSVATVLSMYYTHLPGPFGEGRSAHGPFLFQPACRHFVPHRRGWTGGCAFGVVGPHQFARSLAQAEFSARHRSFYSSRDLTAQYLVVPHNRGAPI